MLAEDQPRRRFTVAEVDLMVAHGIFADGERIELLDGELVHMNPHGPSHAWRIAHLDKVLGEAYGERAHVRCQLPLQLGDRSLPEPDLAVLPGAAIDYADRHPRGTEAILVIEIVSTALRAARRKVALYGRAGVEHYWLVDVERGLVEAYERPGAEGYGSMRAATGGDVLVLPQLAIEWPVQRVTL